MSGATHVVIRDYRPGDREAALRVLTAAFEGAPDVGTMVGSGPGAAERLRRLNAMAFDPAARLHILIAERDATIGGVLTWADPPDCSAWPMPWPWRSGSTPSCGICH